MAFPELLVSPTLVYPFCKITFGSVWSVGLIGEFDFDGAITHPCMTAVQCISGTGSKRRI